MPVSTMSQEQYSNEQNIKAVILVGGLDFGRCPLASRLRKALWPLADKPVLQHLIERIADQGVQKLVIYCDGDSSSLRDVLDIPSRVDVKFLDESLPRGTAGCILDAADVDTDELLFVLNASTLIAPDIPAAAEAHYKADADMTILLNPSSNGNGMTGDSVQAYICGHSILKYIPKAGFCDIKEALIPQLVQADKTIHAVELTENGSSFRSWRQYLAAIGDFLQRAHGNDRILSRYNQCNMQDVWTADDVQVHSSAKIFGPVIICERAKVSEDAIVFGPTIIGPDVTIGSGNLIAGSVLWDRASVADNCQVRNCLLDYDVIVRPGQILEEQLLSKKQGLIACLSEKLLAVTASGAVRLWTGITIILTCLIAAYWRPVIVDLWETWWRSDEYSSGMLVPFIAVYILWLRRKSIMQCPIRPSMWGIAAFAAAQGLRFLGPYLMLASAENLSLVLTITALVLLLFGWQLFYKLLPVLLFMLLMLPLPNRVQTAVTQPLQEWATISAVFSLETIGYEIVREGNIIDLNGTKVGVAEACSGLRMITAFFVISGLVVLIVHRRWWEKLIILASSIPIALMCNTLRLTLTAMAFTKIEAAQWEKLFHDFGGLAMMPLAVAIVVFELWVLSNLTVELKKTDTQIVYKRSAT
jgi:exosortase